jgi:hypothetical protein
MKVDRYTKIVLTIIAACLVWMSLGGPSLIPTTHAASPEVVYIAGVWDLDNTPHTFLKQGKPTGVTIPVEIVNPSPEARDHNKR